MNGKNFEKQYRLLISDFIRSVDADLGKTEKLAVSTLVFRALSTGWTGEHPTFSSMLLVGMSLFQGVSKNV